MQFYQSAVGTVHFKLCLYMARAYGSLFNLLPVNNGLKSVVTKSSEPTALQLRVKKP